MTAETGPSFIGAQPVPRGDGSGSPPSSSPRLVEGESGALGAEQGSAPPAAATPLVATTRDELALALAALRGAARRVALVPTMGALHAGHRALLVRARELADAVVVSIFVNPLQFGPNEDFGRYPRPFDADLAVCTEEQVAVVFAPAPEVMYAREPLVTIEPGPMGAGLEGMTRPGHFAGVLTVVTKLLHLVRPDVAVFGEKDAQQLALIRRLVTDLDFPVRIEAHPIVREPDGLALSSRNRYLTPAERQTATAVSRALAAGAARAASGADAVREHARRVLDDASRAEPPLRLDYLALVDPETFTEVDDGYQGEATLAVAAYVGTTRLIDNKRLALGQPPAPVESQPVSTERGRSGGPAPPLEPPDARPDTGETETRGGAEDPREGGDR